MNENQNYGTNMLQPVPNSTGVLVLGILSIVGCFVYGIIGLVCGIIALVLANKGNEMYQSNPQSYTPASYSNLKAGKVCAIVGTVLSAIVFLFMVLALAGLVSGSYMNSYR